MKTDFKNIIIVVLVGVFDRWKKGLCSLYFIYKDSFLLFYRKSGVTMAAASSFYVIISLMPLFLLIARLLGFFVGDVTIGTEKIFEFLQHIFPNVGIDLLVKIKVLISGPLFAKTSYNFLNMILFFISGLTFFNTIWNGFYILTEDKNHINFKKYFKGMVIVVFTILFVLSLLIVPALLYYIFNFVNHSHLIDSLLGHFSYLEPIIIYFKNINGEIFLFFKSNLFHGMLFLTYFTFFFKVSLSGKIQWKNAFLGGANFVLGLLLLKNFFWIYLHYVRTGFVENYGDYYTFILALMWVFFVMCIFFFSASLTHSGELKGNSGS